jgi:hypothetical protein
VALLAIEDGLAKNLNSSMVVFPLKKEETAAFLEGT